MNHLDPMENRFKEGLEAFQDVAPSRSLYRRIEWTLFKRSVIKLNKWKRVMILLLLLMLSFWTAYSFILNKIEKPEQNYAENILKSDTNTTLTSNPIQKNIPTEENIIESKNQSELIEEQESKSQTTIAYKADVVKSVDSAPEIVIDNLPEGAPDMNFVEVGKEENTKVVEQESGFDLKMDFLQLRFLNPIPNVTSFNLESNRHNFYNYKWKYFQTELAFGLSYAPSNITTKDPMWNDFVDYRTDTERPVLTTNLGVNGRYQIKDWYILSGVHYYSFTDRITQYYDLLQINTIVTTQYYNYEYYSEVITGYLNDPFDSIPIIDRVLDSVVVVENKSAIFDSAYVNTPHTFQNTLSYIEIPLRVGYEFKYKAWMLDVSAGIAYSRLVQQQVKYPNQGLNELIDYSTQSQILRSQNFNAQLGLGIAYQYRPNSAFFIRPLYSFQLKSNFEDAYPVQQKYHHLRLSAGLRFNM
jgi:hypothetical protein